MWYLLAFAFLVRLGLVLSFDGYLGVDIGAYLISKNLAAGEPLYGPAIPHPPLGPGYLLLPFTWLWGDDIGYKIWSATTSLLPIIPIYLIARHLCNSKIAFAAAAFGAFDLLLAEMLVTGTLPLIGMSLLAMGIYGILRIYGDEQRRPLFQPLQQHHISKMEWAVFAGVMIGAIPWVNQTSAAMAVMLLPVFVLAMWWFNDDKQARWATVVVAGVAICIGAAALPYYLAVVPGSDALRYGGPLFFPANFADEAWGQLFLIALPLGIFAIWKSGTPEVRALGVLIIAVGLMAPWLSNDEALINPFFRARYFMAFIFYPLIARVIEYYAVGNGIKWDIACSLAAIAVFGLVVWGSVWTFHNQNRYSTQVTPDTARALELVDGTTGTNAFSLALLVSALNRVDTHFLGTAQPPPKYQANERDLRCIVGWVPGCDHTAAKTRLGIEYVLVEERFPGVNRRTDPRDYMAPDNQWAVTAATPWLDLIFSEGTTRLYRVN